MGKLVLLQGGKAVSEVEHMPERIAVEANTDIDAIELHRVHED